LDDIKDGDTKPYYSQLGFNQIFGDTPYRIDYENDHIWDAELYLAQESREGNSKKVTIYNGVQWGWRNQTFRRGAADICKSPEYLKCIKHPPNTPIDLAFVFDTTGSMGGYLNGMKNNFKNIAKDLFERVPGTRIAVVDYKDFPIYPYGGDGDYPYRADLPFSSDIASIDSAINNLTTGGGGDIPESLWSGLTGTIKTENLGGWRNGVKKSIIYLTDAPAHDPEPFTGYTTRDVIDESLRVDPAVIYGIVPEYLSSDISLARLSSWTGGKLLSVKNSDDVTLKIIESLTHLNGAPITSSYDDSKSPTSVPEPTPVIGLFALSAWGIMKALKIRKSQ
jgi:von Willebrand factor type A domain